jgi:hypothetical protein
MKVYIVTHMVPYEGDEILGVFAIQALTESYVKEKGKEIWYRPEQLFIEEWDVEGEQDELSE